MTFPSRHASTTFSTTKINLFYWHFCSCLVKPLLLLLPFKMRYTLFHHFALTQLYKTDFISWLVYLTWHIFYHHASLFFNCLYVLSTSLIILLLSQSCCCLFLHFLLFSFSDMRCFSRVHLNQATVLIA